MDDHDNEPGSGSEVTLEVPSEPRYLGTLRVTAASLLTAWELDIHRVEELRVAVTEACAELWSRHGRGGTLRITFAAEPDEVRIGLQVHGPTNSASNDGFAGTGVSGASILEHLADHVASSPSAQRIDLAVRR